MPYEENKYNFFLKQRTPSHLAVIKNDAGLRLSFSDRKAMSIFLDQTSSGHLTNAVFGSQN